MADRVPPETADSELVVMGRVIGVYGVRGWVKVRSHTRDRAGILDYDRWLVRRADQWQEFGLAEGRVHGAGLVARLEGITERSAAATLVGADIAVRKSQLPAPEGGAYYWTQLEGMKVINVQGVELGKVSGLFETGANDVMVVIGERERLIPFVRGVIKKVDLAAGTMHVDWDADF